MIYSATQLSTTCIEFKVQIVVIKNMHFNKNAMNKNVKIGVKYKFY